MQTLYIPRRTVAVPTIRPDSLKVTEPGGARFREELSREEGAGAVSLMIALKTWWIHVTGADRGEGGGIDGTCMRVGQVPVSKLIGSRAQQSLGRESSWFWSVSSLGFNFVL